MAKQIINRATTEGFDVTAIIGHVSFDSSGEETPVEAAMKLIGRHNAPGEYHFPHEDGGEWVVSMEHSPQEEPRSW